MSPLPPLLPTERDLGRGSVDVIEESYIQEGSALTRRYLLHRSADLIVSFLSACRPSNPIEMLDAFLQAVPRTRAGIAIQHRV